MTDPKAVDAKLAEAYTARQQAAGHLTALLVQAHHLVGDEPKTYYVGRRQMKEPYRLTDDEAIVELETNGAVNSYDSYRVPALLDGIATDQLKVAKAREIIAECDAEFAAAGGWTRFFLVPEGHIHSSMHCSTCNNGIYATQFGWLPELSGETEAEAVAAHGALLCTVCYPTAPVEWTNKYELEEAAKQAARCEGSGKGYDPTQPFEVRRMSKWGTCTSCNTRQTVTSTGLIRAHKAER